MNRYFLELAYKGTKYSGFQVQENAITIQSEVEKAFSTFFRKEFRMTGSSRTDAGVHALQNFFHFDSEEIIEERSVYNINSILPDDIVVKSITLMNSLQDGHVPHARFDAISRAYRYFIGRSKDPFTKETVLYYPYKLDIDRLQECALLLKEYTDFTSFSKNWDTRSSFAADGAGALGLAWACACAPLAAITMAATCSIRSFDIMTGPPATHSHVGTITICR